MKNDFEHSEKYKHARDTLPDELIPIFNQFVHDYKLAGVKRYGTPFVSYIILADMVRAGWRLSTDPITKI